MSDLNRYINSSIGRKQIVATTGLLLILFIIGHLAGNLLFLLGPKAFNAYAHKMASLRPGLYVVEAGLGLIFFLHIFVTALLVIENVKSRGLSRYAVDKARGQRSLATRIMPYTGTILFIFLAQHLMDFTFIDKHGPRSYVNGESYELYGVVFNAFLDPLHSALYILAMGSLGFHLSHGVQSFLQTFGVNRPGLTSMIKNISVGFGLLIAFGFSSIPLYVLFYAK